MIYDFLIVGSGLFGSICARELSLRGFKCLVLEKRNHIGGNIYTEKIDDINVHKYGAHIFHTNDKSIWDYINQFAVFNRYTNSPVAIYKDKLYNLPFNMNTFYQIWGERNPQKIKEIIDTQIARFGVKDPQNLEEQAINLVGKDIYEILIKGYTEKQWGRDAKTLPAFIIKRLPIRFTYDNNYFNDNYQGIPIGGYTQIIEKMLEGIEVKLDTDFLADKDHWLTQAKKIIYTGPVDAYFDYQFEALEYRSLHFETETLDIENYQGNAVVNYTEKEIPFTRIIEHKHFEFGKQNKTIITKEYPKNWSEGDEAFYPINDSINQKKYAEYEKLKKTEEKVFFGGRLAEYKYYDMHQIIGSALKTIKTICHE